MDVEELEKYVLAILREHDRRYEERFRSSEIAVRVALDAVRDRKESGFAIISYVISIMSFVASLYLILRK